jgi:hypothetical protein
MFKDLGPMEEAKSEVDSQQIAFFVDQNRRKVRKRKKGRNKQRNKLLLQLSKTRQKLLRRCNEQTVWMTF